MPKYTPNLDDKDSIYYWGMDTKYKPTSSKPTPKPRSSAEFDIGLDGVPYKVNGSTGARGSGLSWSENGRPYIMDNGRRVFAGNAASRYDETPEAAVDNFENLEGGTSYTGNETRQVVVPETPADTRTLDRSPVSKVSAEEALAGFMSKLSSEYGINYGGSGNVSGVPKAMVDTSTGENVSITNGPNAGKTISVNDPDFDEVVSGKKQGGMTEISGVTSKKLADALSDTESLRYNPREGAYE